ncbi:MAG TPA: hypothetical protein VGD43_13155, partial [Micromonospora sp.]
MVMQKDNSGMQENVEVTGPAAGVATVLPRWVADPAAGTGVHELELPERLVTALDGLTGTGNDALLAAHAAVLAALTGDREVATGHIGPDGPDGPRTRWLTVGGGTWRALLDRVAGTATEADDPAGTAPTPYEVVLDLSGAPASDDLPDGVVLRIA